MHSQSDESLALHTSAVRRVAPVAGLAALWPSSDRPAWERRVTMAAVVYAVLAAVAMGLFSGLAASATGTVRLVQLFLSAPVWALAVGLAWRAISEPSLDPATRRLWRTVVAVLVLSAVACLFPLLPGMSWLRGKTGLRAVAGIGLAMLLLIAMLRLPSAPRTRVGKVTLLFDVATLVIGGWLVAWYDVTTTPVGGDPLLPKLLWLEYLQGIAALTVFEICIVMWRRTALLHRANALLLIGVAMALIFVGHVSTIRGLHGEAFLAEPITTVLPIVCLLFALAAQSTSVGILNTVPRSHSTTRAYGLSVIPALAILPGFVLLLQLTIRERHQPLLGLTVGAAILTALTLTRQFIASFLAIRKLAAVSARESEARFRALVQHSSDVIIIVDRDGYLQYASPAITTVFGYDPAAMVGTSLVSLIHPEDQESASQFLADLANNRLRTDPSVASALKHEWRFVNSESTWQTVDVAGTNLLNEPVIRGLVLNCRDVTEQSLIKEQYAHQAFHDSLTDLANRSLFLYQVGHALARGTRKGAPVTVLFLDLDNFKTVNDSLGHAAGDRLLIDAARRLASCVRSSDLISRLGGDEFAVLMEDTESMDEVNAVAARIGAALSRPFVLGNKEVFVSSSIGIARSEPGETADELIRNADVAMYVAKNRGKGQYVQFEKQMHAAALEKLVVEADLRRAVDNEEFFLQYQPIVNLETGDIIGAEALVRWLNRDRGLVPPGMFIPVAERTGLIVPLGRWVLRRACIEARRWTRERGLPVRITVNLSGRQLQDEAIVDDVREALTDSGLDPGQLVLELTESILMQNTGLSMQRLLALKDLGVSLAIDDFGTGYSSLSYLQRYPVDILKIDKSFVDAIDGEGEGPVLAKAIVALGETLQMNTVAEGIETESQRGYLLTLGCELGQGYLFAPPLDGQDFWHLLLARGSRSPYVSKRLRETGEQQAA